MFAVIDLSAITDNITLVSVAIVGIGATVIGAAIGPAAIKWGAGWAKGLFKVMFR